MDILSLVIDAIIVIFLIGSVFRGYKKGFVNCFISFVGVIVIIFITMSIYPSVSTLIKNKTEIDSQIYNSVHNTIAITNNSSNNIDLGGINKGIDNVLNVAIGNTASKATNVVIDIISFGLVFTILLIILSIAKLILNAMCELPVLHQFNELGGAALNLVTSVIKLYIIFAIISIIAQYGYVKEINTVVDKTSLAKTIYRNNVVKTFIEGKINKAK